MPLYNADAICCDRGTRWAEPVLDVSNAYVVLLNIGQEEKVKVGKTIRDTAAILRKVPGINFIGYF